MRRTALVVAAFFFLLAGLNHFLATRMYLRIMPPAIPWPLAMVYVSGVAEMAGGAGLLVPRLRRAAGWGLAALLVAVCPANWYMAARDIQVTLNPIPAWALWARLPLQLPLIGWVLWCSGALSGVMSRLGGD